MQHGLSVLCAASPANRYSEKSDNEYKLKAAFYSKILGYSVFISIFSACWTKRVLTQQVPLKQWCTNKFNKSYFLFIFIYWTRLKLHLSLFTCAINFTKTMFLFMGLYCCKKTYLPLFSFTVLDYSCSSVLCTALYKSLSPSHLCQMSFTCVMFKICFLKKSAIFSISHFQENLSWTEGYIQNIPLYAQVRFEWSHELNIKHRQEHDQRYVMCIVIRILGC